MLTKKQNSINLIKIFAIHSILFRKFQYRLITLLIYFVTILTIRIRVYEINWSFSILNIKFNKQEQFKVLIVKVVNVIVTWYSELLYI